MSTADESTNLSGRNALVVGASSGIGAAITRALLREGASVDALARRHVDTWELGDASGHGSLRQHQVDITNRESLDKLLHAIVELKAIDVLVLAAGTNLTDRRWHQVAPDAWDELFAVNATSAFLVTNALRAPLRRAGGDIVIISSVSALWPDQSGVIYQASKAALNAFARALSAEEHQYGVRVISILPGMVNTSLLSKRPQPPTKAERLSMIQPDDVADVCVSALLMPRRTTLAEIVMVPTRSQTVGFTNGPSIPLDDYSSEPNAWSEGMNRP